MLLAKTTFLGKKLLNMSIFSVFYVYLGILPIAYCLLPMPGWMHSAAWMHTASECILPLNAYCL